MLKRHNIIAWADSVAAAEDLTTSFVASGYGVMDAVPEANMLHLSCVLTGTWGAGSKFHIQLMPTLPGGSEEGAEPVVNYVSGNECNMGPGDFAIDNPGAGTFLMKIPVTPGAAYKVYAKRTGGGADETALVKAHFYMA